MKRALGTEQVAVLDVGAGSGLLSMMAARYATVCFRHIACMHGWIPQHVKRLLPDCDCLDQGAALSWYPGIPGADLAGSRPCQQLNSLSNVHAFLNDNITSCKLHHQWLSPS